VPQVSGITLAGHIESHDINEEAKHAAMNRTMMRCILSGAVTLTLGAIGLSGQGNGRGFEIPGHGNLRLAVPDSWIADARPIGNPASVALHFTPKAVKEFDLQVTSVWLDSSKLAKTNGDSIRKNMQRAGNGLLSHSIEKTVTLREIHGNTSVGWCFTLTDRNPGPGEFRFLTQGAFLTGEVLSAFTVLHRDMNTPEVATALEAFSNASHAK
jgi:hypothetical protein